MLKFFLDKFRESPGPLKQARLVLGDIIEELADLAGHYFRRGETGEATANEPRSQPEPTPPRPAPAEPTPRPAPKSRKGPAASKKKAAPKAAAKKRTPRPPEAPPRTLDVPPELERALETPANQKKQEFKVLAILWDAHERKLGALSAKELSAHGTALGLVIRHENVRKDMRQFYRDCPMKRDSLRRVRSVAL